MTGLKRKQENSANDSRKGSDDDPPQARPKPPSHRYSNYEHPTEEEHRTAEQFSWRNNYTLNVGIAIAAVITVILATGTFWETRRQANAAAQSLIQSNRAWIRVAIKPESVSITWPKNKTLEFDAEVTASNEGNSPALDTQVFAILFAATSGKSDDTRQAMIDRCRGIDGAGNIQFPKDRDITVDGKQKTDGASITNYIDSVQKYFIEEKTPIPILFGIAVCAYYRIAGDTAAHYSIQVWDAGVSITDGKLQVGLVGYDMPLGHVALKREVDGEYAD